MDVQEAPLATYLREHLAGSYAAEAIANRVIERSDDTGTRAFLERFVTDIVKDRSEIEALLEDLDDGRGLVRRALDAATEAAGKAADMASPSPGDFADLEALALGVWGKRLLWGTLARLAEVDPRFQGIPLDALMERAERQEKELIRLRHKAIVPSLAPRSGEGTGGIAALDRQL
jgi:hypothetical protein